MTVAEVTDALTVQLGKHPHVDLSLRIEDENDIFQICLGLVSVSDGYHFSYFYQVPTLRIAHFSVQEYLESKRIEQQAAAYYRIEKRLAHTELAEVCLTYLLDQAFSTELLDKSIYVDRPLALFAAKYWYYHYKNATVTSRTEQLVVALFRDSQNNFRNWVRLCDLDELSRSSTEEGSDAFTVWASPDLERPKNSIASPFCYACILGLTFAVEGFLHDNESDVKLKYHGGPLQAASYRGNERLVRHLLDTGADINECGGYHGNSLQAASSGGYAGVVRCLIAFGANVNARPEYSGDNALGIASEMGHKDVVDILLASGANVNDGSGALRKASSGGHTDIVRSLTSFGANVNARSGYEGDTALHIASEKGHKDIVNILLNSGAETNLRNLFVTSALQNALRHSSSDIVQLLIHKGATFDIQSGDAFIRGPFSDMNPVDILDEAAAFGSSNVLRLLLDNGVSLNENFEDLLETSAKAGQKEVVKLLLERAFETHSNIDIMKRAISMASRGGFIEIVQLLLIHGADPNAEPEYLLPHALRTPLEEASAFNHGDVVCLLLAWGANVNYVSSPRGGGFGALQAASFSGHEILVLLLLNEGAEPNARDGTPLISAAFTGDVGIVRLLVDYGADVNHRSYFSALQVAAWKGRTEVLELLLQNGANINLKGSDFDDQFLKEHSHTSQPCLRCAKARNLLNFLECKNDLERARISSEVEFLLDSTQVRGEFSLVCDAFGPLWSDHYEGRDPRTEKWRTKLPHYCTPLQIALDRGHDEDAALLLYKGADIEAQSIMFGSALQVALLRRNEELVRLLLNKNASVHTVGGFLSTPLQAAASVGWLQAVQILLDRGADINAQGGDFGNTLVAALSNKHPSVVRLLLDNGAQSDVSHTPYGFFRAPYIASEEGNMERLQSLPNKCSSLHTCNGESYETIPSCEIFPRAGGNGEVVRLWLDKGADINGKNRYGETLLYEATRGGELEAMQILIENGANVNATCENGKSPLWIACSNAITAKPRGNEKSFSRRYSYMKIIEFLLGNGADINLPDSNALAAVAEKGDMELAQILFDHGGDVNGTATAWRASHVDMGSNTVLQAVIKGDVGSIKYEVIRWLLDKGAGVNHCDTNTVSVLREAVEHEPHELVKLLLERGADPNMDNQGSEDSPIGASATLVQVALRRRDRKLALLLLRWGAKATAKEMQLLG